ncbi:MAG: hybrid sensor histidine kinase/response regulator, partial [Tannerellaceae bacterium]|nr:hybrid sensor histidine kinase/response regulator [Tannerellaceae bacterium]
IPVNGWGYRRRQCSSRNGLSNSAIQAICQDSEGFMWFGSCDGLNCFDGLNIEVYKPTDESNLLSGNLIENIIEAGDGFLWVQTNYGLDLIDKKKKTIRTYNEFNSRNYPAVSERKDIYIIYEDNSISYFDRENLSFHKKQVDAISFDNILDIVIDKQDLLWIFTRDSKCLTYQIERVGEHVHFIRRDLYQHQTNFLYCFHEGRFVYFVDDTYNLYELNLDQMKTMHIFNLSQQIRIKGEISSTIRHHNDFYIGFKSSGLVQLKEVNNRHLRFVVNELDIHSGIFCLVKDRYQDVIWVGTDGQGVFMYYVDSFTLRSNSLSSLPIQISNPVRALLIDDFNDLWIGTKGDGIICIKEYNLNTGITRRKTEHLHTGNTSLLDNSVYAFSKSGRPLLWIGTEEGLNYYSFKNREIKRIRTAEGERPVRYIHSICEINDVVLWVATVGEGIVKITLGGTG